MRDRTQARIEELALQHGDKQIELARVEEGIELGLQTMAELVAAQADGQENVNLSAEQSEHTAKAAKCPAVGRTETEAYESQPAQPLNEVSQLTELSAMRLLLTKQREPAQD